MSNEFNFTHDEFEIPVRNQVRTVQDAVVLETQVVCLGWRHSFGSHSTYEIVKSAGLENRVTQRLYIQ